MAITTTTEFASTYLVKNGEIANETTINRAPAQLKTEINELKDELQNVVISGGGVSTFADLTDVTATAAEVDTLSGFTGSTSDLNLLPTYRTKIPFLANVTSDIQNQINTLSNAVGGDAVTLASLGLTATAAQINWLSIIANDFNRSNVDGTEISYLNGLSGNIQSQLNTINTAITNISTGGAAITVSSITDLTNVNAIQLNWIGDLYDSRIQATELQHINGLTTNVQAKFDEIDTTINSISGSSTVNFTDITEGLNYVSGNVGGTIELGGATGVSWPGTSYSSSGQWRGLFGINQSSGTSYTAGMYVKSASSIGIAVGVTKSNQPGIASAASGSSVGAAGVVGSSEGWVGVQGEGVYGFYTNSQSYLGGSTYPFTGSHYTFSNESVDVGDIVCITETIGLGVNNSIPYVVKSSVAKSKASYGVYNGDVKTDIDEFLNQYAELTEEDTTVEVHPSTPAARKLRGEWLSLRDSLTSSNYAAKGVNAIGEGMINVCEENGNIEIGDFICTSNVAGKGMKQTEDYLANFTVAKSSTNVDWTTETVGENGCFEVDGVKCKMISCTYHCG